MSSDRSFSRQFVLVAICAAALCILVPLNFLAERDGIPAEGVIVRYDNGRTSFRQYPVVRVEIDGQETDLRARSAWRLKWYDVGERVPVLVVKQRVVVGSFFVRWFEVFLAATIIVGAIAVGLLRRDRPFPRRDPLPPLPRSGQADEPITR